MKKRMRHREDLWRWLRAERRHHHSALRTVEGFCFLQSLCLERILISPLCTPISPSHSPHAHAVAALAVDSHSIYTYPGLFV